MTIDPINWMTSFFIGISAMLAILIATLSAGTHPEESVDPDPRVRKTDFAGPLYLEATSLSIRYELAT